MWLLWAICFDSQYNLNASREKWCIDVNHLHMISAVHNWNWQNNNIVYVGYPCMSRRITVVAVNLTNVCVWTRTCLFVCVGGDAGGGGGVGGGGGRLRVCATTNYIEPKPFGGRARKSGTLSTNFVYQLYTDMFTRDANASHSMSSHINSLVSFVLCGGYSGLQSFVLFVTNWYISAHIKHLYVYACFSISLYLIPLMPYWRSVHTIRYSTFIYCAL